jgi:hypothetical protein
MQYRYEWLNDEIFSTGDAPLRHMLCLSYARMQSHSEYHPWYFQAPAALGYHLLVDNRANSPELQGAQAR